MLLLLLLLNHLFWVSKVALAMFQPTGSSLLKREAAGSGTLPTPTPRHPRSHPQVGRAFKAPSRGAAEGRSLELLSRLSPPQRAAVLGRRDPSTAQQLLDPVRGTPDARAHGSGLAISGRQGKVGALQDPRRSGVWPWAVRIDGDIATLLLPQGPGGAGAREGWGRTFGGDPLDLE